MDSILPYIDNISEKNIEKNTLSENLIEIKKILCGYSTKRKSQELRAAIEMLINSIQKKDYKKSFGFARFIFFSDFKDPISAIKKAGAFRPSRYGYEIKLLKFLINDLLSKGEFDNGDKQYLDSVIAMIHISPDILSIKLKIQGFIKSRPYFLKNALALAEAKFIDMALRDGNNATNIQDGLYFSSRETFLASVSYTLQLLKEVKGNIISKESIYVENCTMDDAYLKTFYDAYLIQIYNEAEINIDFFEYSARLTEKNNVRIENYDFELATRAGYAKSDLRWASIFSMLTGSSDYKNYEKFHEAMYHLCKDGFAEKAFYEIIKEPIERIIVKAMFLNVEGEQDFFSMNALFFEEFAMLWTLSSENYNSRFVTQIIFKGFTALDILKLQRFFGYLSYIYNHAYTKLVKSNHPSANSVRKWSILPVMKTYKLAEIFHKICGHSIEDCLTFINKISIDFSKKNDFIDLQYCPVIKMGNASLILPTVFSSSNLIRALALNEKIHLSRIENTDFMITSIQSSLQNAGFTVRTDFVYGNIEIDILACRDDFLFIFECKNPYHPVNSYELRNTYSHIKKGVSQIKRIKGVLEDKESLKQLLHKANIKTGKIRGKYYGVINANRALCGLVKDDVCVYHANELMHFIETGEVAVSNETYNTWQSDQFSIDDFIRYLKGEVVRKELEEVKQDVFYKYKIGSSYITLMSTVFEVHKIHDIYRKKYNLKDINYN
nr:hypothetical protein [Pantoea cypripedii]